MAQLIATHNIMELCLEAERRPGYRVAKWWWEQDGLRLAGAQEDGEMEMEGSAELKGTDD